MSVPYKCPVCSGRCKVPKGFYDWYFRYDDSATNFREEYESCRSCGGTGVVWSIPDIQHIISRPLFDFEVVHETRPQDFIIDLFEGAD